KPAGENNAPVADGAYLAATEDTEAGGTLIADDQDGDSLIYSITTNGSMGQVTITNSSTGDYIYVPDSDATGIDSFSFKANDGNLDSNIASVTINIAPVNDAPVASASASTETGQAPLIVIFDAGASSDIDGTISNYAWNFGDGEIGNGSVVEHIFEVAGTYTIDLIITDDEGGIADTSVVVAVTAAPQVNQSPTASFSASVTSGEAPLEDVKFDGTLSYDSDGNISGYIWDFGDGGATGSGSVAYHTFPVGSFNVVLTVIDNDGASAQTTVVISATTPTQTNELPSAEISAGALEGPAPFLVSFDGSGSNDPDGQITDYSWSFGDGNTGAGVSVQHTFTEPGVYTTTLTVTDNQDGTSNASVTVTVTTETQQDLLPLETGEVEI
ncbi:MAG: PKD domain-containing protein, partial [Desulfobulbaceae bacterium]|nr:PKD domain-containing protein [Desulfobulbaceae bacterium]